jgi:hypothetical protein
MGHGASVGGPDEWLVPSAPTGRGGICGGEVSPGCTLSITHKYARSEDVLAEEIRAQARYFSAVLV